MKTQNRTAAQHKRRWQADPAAIYKTMARIQPFTLAEQTTITLPVRVAFEALRTGAGTFDDFDTLAECLNVAVVYSESIDMLCEQTCVQAQQALMLARARHAATGRWGLCWRGLQHIPPALDLYEQMVALSTPKQLIDCMKVTQSRMRAGTVLRMEDVQ